jgi:hypothetical protein
MFNNFRKNSQIFLSNHFGTYILPTFRMILKNQIHTKKYSIAVNGYRKRLYYQMQYRHIVTLTILFILKLLCYVLKHKNNTLDHQTVPNIVSQHLTLTLFIFILQTCHHGKCLCGCKIILNKFHL